MYIANTYYFDIGYALFFIVILYETQKTQYTLVLLKYNTSKIM